MRIVSTLKWVWLSHQTTAFLGSRHVLLCLVLAIWHPHILFLLPFLWIYDAFIREYLLNVFVYRQYLNQLSTDVIETTPYIGELGLITNIVSESSKYELNQQLSAYSKWRKREKKTILLQYTNWGRMAPSSYSSMADYNVIIIPFNFDSSNIQHAVMVAHEYNHAMGHDGYKVEIYTIILSCIGATAIFAVYSLLSNPNWIVLLIGFFSIAYLIYKVLWNFDYYKELDADIGAIRYFENMDLLGSYQVPTRNGRTVLQEVAYDIAYTRNNSKYIKPLWPFLRTDDQNKLMKKIPGIKPHRWKYKYSSTEDIYMVLHDGETAFALLLLFVSCIISCVYILNYITIPWYFLFLAIVPYILLTSSIIKSNKLWKKKQDLLKKIGCE